MLRRNNHFILTNNLTASYLAGSFQHRQRAPLPVIDNHNNNAVRFQSSSSTTTATGSNNNPDPNVHIQSLQHKINLLRHSLHPEVYQVTPSSLSEGDQAQLDFLKTVDKTEIWKQINAKENTLATLEFDLSVKDSAMDGVAKLQQSAKSGFRFGANVLGIPLLMYINYWLYIILRDWHGFFGGSEDYEKVKKEEEEKKNKKSWF